VSPPTSPRTERFRRRHSYPAGSLLRPLPDDEKALIAADLRRAVWPLVESGRVRPVVHAVLPLTAAAEAHRLMEAGQHVGKLVLDVAANAAFA
jgi:NADPH2:quinone reductase